MKRKRFLKQCAINAVIILIILVVYFVSTHPLAAQVAGEIAGLPSYKGSQNIALCFKVEQTIPQRILRTLDELEVPATFFVSQQAGKDTRLMKQLNDAGHEIGVLGGISSQEVQETTQKLERSFHQAGLKLSNYYMPADHIRMADAHTSAAFGYQMVICGLQVFKAELSKQNAAAFIRHTLYEGAYILIPTAEEADSILKKIIQNAKEKGFIFSTLSDTK
jgi:hypothetical protein